MELPLQLDRSAAANSTVLRGIALEAPDQAPLALQVCRRHLRLLGADVALGPRSGGNQIRLCWGHPEQPSEGGLTGALTWFGPAHAGADGSEALVQARCGLMEVNGRDGGRPRRLGLEVASVAAGILASQGILAGLVGRALGWDVASVETSVAQAALMSVNHYLAIATGDGEEPLVARSEQGPGPPFPTSDGQWVELEVLDPDRWLAFWLAVGLDARTAGRGWVPFAARHETARCPLPPALHGATAARTVNELAATAAHCGVSLCRLRTYRELIQPDADPRETPWRIRAESSPFSPPLPASGGGGQRGPLAGLRVVEATRRIQGPLAGLLLSLLGAEVVRIEPPGGDLLRLVSPAAGDVGAIFQSLNRGKSAVELDLHHRSGRDGVLELIGDADVLLHNWRPGRDAELGLDAETCHRVNPSVVYAHAGGWGERAEACPPVATDAIVQAHAALGDGLNPVGEPPFPSRMVLADFMGGLVACEAIVAALWLRCRSGRGSRVDTDLFGAAMALQAHVLEASASGEGQGRREGRPVWGPLQRPIETADGFVVVADDVAGLSRACGLPTESATEDGLVDLFRSRATEAWEKRLADAGIACAAVCTDLASLATDATLAPFLESVGGTCQVPAAPWRFLP